MDPTLKAMLDNLQKSIDDNVGALDTRTKEMEAQYKALKAHFEGKSASDAEVAAAIKKHQDEYAAMAADVTALKTNIDTLKKDLDHPLLTGSHKDRKDKDVQLAIELQRRVHISKNGNDDEFTPDMTNLVNPDDMRSALRKWMQVGVKSREEIRKSFTTVEQKAFDSASLDQGFFMPEMLGIEIDCEIECDAMLDLYEPVNVSRSTFIFPVIQSYGDLGSYQCDANCDAELGPEGNIVYRNGKTHEFRGVFCFQKKVLAEANYDLLGFMMRSAQRSHRINRNRVMISGDGVNEPMGWLTANCFPEIQTPQRDLDGTGPLPAQPSFTHVDFRRFMSLLPIEYGAFQAVMHQNMFGYLASQVDADGRFIFGDGLMTFSPDDVRERIRISNCLPDPTQGGTVGSASNPFPVGAFLVAAANWRMAFKSISKRALFMEQFLGQTSAWCVKYQFGAEDGGFVGCCNAGRVLRVG